MTTPQSSTTEPSPWQTRLEDMCRESQIAAPVFQLISDRRGGRTAWSSLVTINTQSIPARYWYDGKNVNIMKEDAAECAVNWLLEVTAGNSTTKGSHGW